MWRKVVTGLWYVVVLGIIIGVFYSTSSFQEKKEQSAYNDCMFLVRNMIPEANPLDRNELCHIIAR